MVINAAPTLVLCASLGLVGCFQKAEASTSNCGPATAAYIAESRAGCEMPDGGYFTLADGRVAPTLYVCTEDGSVTESWCQ